MGRALIKKNIGAGQYEIEILQDRSKADRNRDMIDRWIALNRDKQDALPLNDPKIPKLKLEMAALIKQRAYYDRIPINKTITTWCVDYSINLSGTVGTIEINGDPDATILIQPGWRGGAAYNAVEDGACSNKWAQTAEQWFYNEAMRPGWKKWMPTFRLGTITSKHNSTCSVLLDAATTTIINAGIKSINVSETLPAVPVQYMDCDGSVFDVGDRVVVGFGNQVAALPYIIGFPDHPRMTTKQIVIYSGYQEQPGTQYGPYYLGAFAANGELFLSLDLNGAYGIPAETPISVIGCHEDSNSVYVILGIGLVRVPISWDYPGLSVREFGYAPVGCDIRLGITVGGWLMYSYGVISDEIPWPYLDSTGTHLYSCGTYYPPGKVELAVTNRMYDEDNHFYPPDYKDHYYAVTAVGFVKNKCYLVETAGLDTITGDLGNHTPYSHDYFQFAQVSQYQFPPHETPPEFGGYNPPVTPYFTGAYPNIAQPNFRNTFYLDSYDSASFGAATDGGFIAGHAARQIIGYEDELFTFYAMAGGYVDIDTGLKAFPCEASWERGDFVQYDDYRVFAVRHHNKQVNGEFWSGPVKFYDPAMNFISEVALEKENPYRYGQVAIMNVPTTCMMLDKLNELRFQYDLQPLALSRNLSAVCQEHADWCVANKYAGHTGANGTDPAARALLGGFFSVSEVVVNMTSRPRAYDEIVVALDGWHKSPHHWAAINGADKIIMGYGSAMYPATVTQIRQGTGTYIPETGGYTTEETIEGISAKDLGKTKIYVMMVAFS